MKRLFLYLVLLLCTGQTVFAQKGRESYEQAHELYRVGRIEEARTLLQKDWSIYSHELYSGACRLMTLCLLEEDETEQAKSYASKLLTDNPYYTTALDDPQRYIDLINGLKKGQATITSASQFEETVQEAPVPVMLITEDMIRQSGARNLQDLLVLYVPGMTRVEGMDVNVAMHGAYSQMQEKMLIMIDGHRLNSHTTNSESLDQRTSLEKIKQIEVLRGPASSLYGNVALSAVVNIKTKDGDDINGFKASVGAGMYNTYKADIVLGKRYMDLNVMAWASIYASQGDKHYCQYGDKDFFSTNGMTKGSYYLGNMRGLPAYDIGAKLKLRDWTLLFTVQRSKKSDVYSPLVTWGIYDFDKYPSIDGYTPGFTRQDINLRLSYAHTWRNFTLNANAFATWEQGNIYYAAGDTLPAITEPFDIREFYHIVMGYPELLDIDKLKYQYAFESQTWRDFTFGATAMGTYNYALKGYKGTLLGGVQFERFKMIDTYMVRGEGEDANYSYLPNSMRSLLLGAEYNISGFAQWKQALPGHLIFNGGLRFDNKIQFNDRTRKAWSPRAAVIFNGLRNTTLKVTYAHSFVDASYLYRASTTLSYLGGENLDPEELDAVQINGEYTFGNSGFTAEANLYYNAYSKLVVMVPGTGMMDNLGKRRLLGIEANGRFHRGRHTAFANLTWQKLLNTDNYTVTDSREIFCVPNIYGSAGYDVNLIRSARFGSLNVNANVGIVGNVKATFTDLSLNPNYTYEVDPATLSTYSQLKTYATLNMGINYRYKALSVDFNLYNLTGTDYLVSGNTPYPIPQQKQTFMGKISVAL